MTLTEKICTACSGDVPALTQAQIASLRGELEGWQVEGDKRLSKTFASTTFRRP